jgi:signal recognition particle GTPase
MKTPLEFVASSVRATGADVTDALPLARQLNNMGMPLYGAQPPTGYSMKAETWVSSSALLNRMNFALALTAGKVRGVKVDAAQLADSPPADASSALTTMEAKLLSSDVSKQTHDSIVQQTQSTNKAPSKPPNASAMAGLLLGSPEFQRR